MAAAELVKLRKRI